MPGIGKVRKEIGANIRSLRKRAGLSQKKLAEKADLHPVYISQVEGGTKAVSVEAAVETIAGVTGADDVAVAGSVKGGGWGPRTVLARGQWTKRGKAAAERKKTESWQDRIMRSKGRIIAGRNIKGGAV